MKKLLVLFAGLTCHSLYASPVLSPNAAAVHTDGVFFCDDCSCYSLRAGFRGDYVFDRKLSTSDALADIENFSLMSNEGVVTLNFWDRLDIYGLVGASSYEGSDSYTSTRGLGSTRNEATSTSSAIWGVGARATILEYNFGCCGTSYLGADINYESIGSSKSSSVTWNGAPVSGLNLTGNYKETQISLQIGHRIAMLTPYIAAKWSNAIFNVRSSSFTIQGRPLPASQRGSRNTGNHWGYAVGVLLIDAGRMSVTAEARFIDEKAMTIMGEFRF